MNKIKIDEDAKWQIFDIIPPTFGFALDASKEPCDTREIAEEKLNKALKSKPHRVCTILPVYRHREMKKDII